MNEKRLLVLGSVEDFTELTKLAVQKGIYTVVADAYNGEAKKYASKAYTVDLQDDRLIDQICKVEKIDHIITSYSDYLFELMVHISERNNLPCFCTGKKVRYLRDKMLMKDMLSSLGIASAKGQRIHLNQLDEINIQLNYPFVIKPIDGWGSRGMAIIHNYQELQQYRLDTENQPNFQGEAMLEDINTGYELNVMSWIKDNKVYFMEFGDRETSEMTNDHLPHQSREVFPTFFYDELEIIIKDYLLRIANFVGIDEGPLSMQFFYENGVVTVGEVAGRFFGLGQGIVPIINGIDLNELLINMLYWPERNMTILEKENAARDHCSIILYLKAKPGIVQDIGNVQSFMDEHSDEYRIYVQPGLSTSMIPWIARVYAHFSTREEADFYTKRVYQQMYVPDLEGNNLMMNNELVDYHGCRWKTSTC